MKTILLSFIFLFFVSCSTKTPPNQWEYKAINATQSYINNFLSNNLSLATRDFQRATTHIKNGASLEHLGKLYLTKCAMERVVSKTVTCKEYQEIEGIFQTSELSAYKKFLVGGIRKEDIKSLPSKYHEFANTLIQEDYEEAIKIMHNTKEIVSMLLMASTLQENLQKQDVAKIIKTTSFYGYIQVTKYWLEYQIDKFNDKNAQRILAELEKRD